MQVTFVSSLAKGGAFAACNRTRIALIKRGVSSRLIVGEHYADSFGEVINARGVIPIQSFLKRRIRSFEDILRYGCSQKMHLRRRPRSLEAFSFPDSYYDITPILNGDKTDIINLHWVSKLLDYESFFKKNSIPVVWTLHDLNPFSGGLHFPDDYESISDEGTLTTYRKSHEEIKVEQKIINKKQEALRGIDNLTIVSPSHWLANLARQSEVFGNFPIHVIPNGVESELFQDVGKEMAREVLQLERDIPTLVFVADSVFSVRKGVQLLISALNRIASKCPFQLCIIGGHLSPELVKGHQLRSFGRIDSEYLLSLIYSAGDATVIPSLHDNFPNTMLESIMCGRPVLALPTGGISEAIHEGENGMIAEEKSLDSFVAVLERFHCQYSHFQHDRIRIDAEARYAMDINSKAYFDCFRSISDSQ